MHQATSMPEGKAWFRQRLAKAARHQRQIDIRRW